MIHIQELHFQYPTGEFSLSIDEFSITKGSNRSEWLWENYAAESDRRYYHTGSGNGQRGQR